MSESLFVAGACERAGGVGMTMLDARVLEERMQCDAGMQDAGGCGLWVVGGCSFRRAGGRARHVRRGALEKVRLERPERRGSFVGLEAGSWSWSWSLIARGAR